MSNEIPNKGCYIYPWLHGRQFLQVAINEHVAKLMLNLLTKCDGTLFNKDFILIHEDEHGSKLYLYKHDLEWLLITVSQYSKD